MYHYSGCCKAKDRLAITFGTYERKTKKEKIKKGVKMDVTSNTTNCYCDPCGYCCYYRTLYCWYCCFSDYGSNEEHCEDLSELLKHKKHRWHIIGDESDSDSDGDSEDEKEVREDDNEDGGDRKSVV